MKTQPEITLASNCTTPRRVYAGVAPWRETEPPTAEALEAAVVRLAEREGKKLDAMRDRFNKRTSRLVVLLARTRR